jgi:hypothetical protein
MSRRGLAADGPHHVSDWGVVQQVQLRPVYGVGGPGWLHEEHMYVCAQVGALLFAH